MKLVSSLALAAAALAGSGLALQPARAAPKKEEAPAAPARKWNFSPEARKPLADLQSAVDKKDEAAYPAALAAAQAVAKTPDDKYVLAKLMTQHAEQVNDAPGRLAGYQALLASGALTPADARAITNNIAILATNAGNWPLAESAMTSLLEADPGNVDNVVNLARTKIQLHKENEALPLLRRAIQLSKAAGQTPAQSWYQNALKIAYANHDNAAVAEINGELLKAYPNANNLKNAIAIYRTSPQFASNEIDLLRLAVASGAAGKNEYIYLASLADQGGIVGEAKGVIDAGRQAGMLGTSDAAQIYAASVPKIAADRASLAGDEAKARAGGTGRLAMNVGNAYYGYGDYAKAADMFRIAAGRSDVDASLANLRLGEALARAGDRAGAEAALRAVTGPRAELAGLWMSWLAVPR